MVSSVGLLTGLYVVLLVVHGLQRRTADCRLYVVLLVAVRVILVVHGLQRWTGDWALRCSSGCSTCSSGCSWSPVSDC